MRLLAEIYRHPDLNLAGKTITREAVRGIILDGSSLMMVYSSKVGDYKFPGGGISSGESHTEALMREIQEECGAQVLQVGGAFGRVIEYIRPYEPDFDLFKMTSSYYRCTIDPILHTQSLDPYERDLGFRPVWVTIDQAIDTNREMLGSSRPDIPRWTARDTLVLELIRQHWNLWAMI